MSATIDNSTPVGPGLTIGDLVADSAMAPAAPVPDQTPTKKKGGRPKKAAALVPKAEPTDNAAEGDALAEPSTPKTPVKRGRKPKTPATTTNEDGEVVVSAPKSTGKRGAPKAADGETPSKKQKATPAKAAATKVAFPTCWEEFTPEDKVIVNMRRNKANWGDIEAEWEKLSGKKPGVDVIRKKYAKLEAVATVFAAGDAAKLAAAKTTVDAAIEEQIKKLRTDKWTKIAEQMKADGADTYKPAAIEKKFEHMVKNNLVDASGAYIGPDESAAATKGNGDLASADAAGEGAEEEEEEIAEAEADEEEA